MVKKNQTASSEEYNVKEARRRLRSKYLKRLRTVEKSQGIVYPEIAKDKVRSSPLSLDELRNMAYESYRQYPTNKGVKLFTNFVVRDRIGLAEMILKRKIALPIDPRTKKPKDITDISFDVANGLIKKELDKVFNTTERVTTMRKQLQEALVIAKSNVKTDDGTIRALRIELSKNPNFSFDRLKGKLSDNLSAEIRNEYNIYFGRPKGAREQVEGMINLSLATTYDKPIVEVKSDNTGDRNALYHAFASSLAGLKDVYYNNEDGGLIWKMDNLAGKGGVVFVIIEGQIVEYINTLDDIFVHRAVQALGTSNLGDFEAYGSKLEVHTSDGYLDYFDEKTTVSDIVAYFKSYIQRLTMKGLDTYIADVEDKTGQKFNQNVYPTDLEAKDKRLYLKAVKEFEKQDKAKQRKLRVYKGK